jgi:enterochelin esterase-like enzyme
LLTLGAGGIAAVGVAGFTGIELVSHNVLPGKSLLDQLDGACAVAGPELVYARLGPAFNGSFDSTAIHQSVGYTIAYPPGHIPGDDLPLVIMLHGYGGDHTNALAGMTPAQAVALKVGGRPLPPMAMVTVDGRYWNPHPGYNPLAMIADELIPLCRARGLGRPPHRIATMGLSLGGYGALLLAEKFPGLITAAAAISPAIWTSYAQARAVNAGAYASAAGFAAYDAVTHASALAGTPVRIAIGYDDPFYPGVRALARVLPAEATVDYASGCHTGEFFLEQEPPSLAFLAQHLSGQAVR